MRRLLLFVSLALSPFCPAASAAAQYPDHPIRMIVPQAAGSSTDTLTRVLAAALSDELHQQVVVDDRHDLYGDKFFKSYLKMIRVEPGWEEFLRDHPAPYVVLPKDAALTSMLLTRNAWKQIYLDDVAIVFEKVR